MEYPIVYLKKSRVLDKVTMALVVEDKNVWRIYGPDNTVIDGKDTGWPIEVFNDPKIGIAFIPTSTRNILRESLRVLNSPLKVIIDDIIKEVNSLTEKEIRQAADQQYKKNK